MKVIYEDNHIIVVEKIVDIPSQADKTEDVDMLTLIKQYLKEKYNKTGNVYLGLVHRLDRPVGGVMAFAKTSKAASRLSELVRNKAFKNTSYVVRENKKNAKKASLDYEVLKYDQEKDVSLLKINLHTGRHHQIRVQLSSRGHSIYGDGKYHGRDSNKPLCLWAYKLSIIHPITKEELTFEDLPEPVEMWEILKTVNI